MCFLALRRTQRHLMLNADCKRAMQFVHMRTLRTTCVADLRRDAV